MKSFALASLAAVALAINNVDTESLAQLDAEKLTGNTCLTAVNRNKAKLPDFWNLVKQTTQWKDPDFTPDLSSIYWKDFGETLKYKYTEGMTWKRPSQLGTYTLWGDGVTYDDMIQGEVGNCWAVAGCSSIAMQKPDILRHAFLNQDQALNKAGIYAVTLWPLGVPHTVVVDDYIPRITMGEKRQNGMADFGTDKSAWGPLLEKAFAKMYGSYDHLEGGSPVIAVEAIIGGIHEYYSNTTHTADQLFAKILAQDATDNITMTATDGKGLDAASNKASGLSGSHAFTVLGAKKLKDGTKLIKMRNPWGKETYKGSWSDTDTTNWTAAHLKEVGHTLNMQDGVFYMPVAQYKKDFYETKINIDPSDMWSTYFLRLNDDGTKTTKCTVSKSATCHKHTLNIKSTVAQTITITGHTWDGRMYPKSCQKKTHVHNMDVSWDSKSWYFGVAQMTGRSVTAGSTTEVTMEFDIGNANVGHDWSITVYGDKGELSIKHKGGLTTQHLPVIAPPQD